MAIEWVTQRQFIIWLDEPFNGDLKSLATIYLEAPTAAKSRAGLFFRIKPEVKINNDPPFSPRKPDGTISRHTLAYDVLSALKNHGYGYIEE